MQRYRFGVPCFGEAPQMIPDDSGEYVKFADIQPVPAPSPWLDQPDGEGGWLFIPKWDEKQWDVFRLFSCPDFGLYYRTSHGRYHISGMVSGRWQRIPQPSLPGEGGER